MTCSRSSWVGLILSTSTAMRKGCTKSRQWWRCYQRGELNSLKSIVAILNIHMSHRSCSISWWTQTSSRIFVMWLFRGANYVKAFRCQHSLVYSMRMRIWFASLSCWTTKARLWTKMRRLCPRRWEKEVQAPWPPAAQKSNWLNNLASRLILKFCKFLMLQLYIQLWKSFKSLNVFRIILKPSSILKWRDTRRLQMTDLLRDFRMNILSSKSRSAEATNCYSLSRIKNKDWLSTKAFMLIWSLLQLSLLCVALNSDTCLWILFSSRFFSPLFTWITSFKSWSWQMTLFNIVIPRSSTSSVLCFVTTRLALFACLTSVAIFMLLMTPLRRIKPWSRRWKSRRQGLWLRMRNIMGWKLKVT